MRFVVICCAMLLVGCASTSERRVIPVDSAQQTVLRYGHSSSQEARDACETRKMRRRALDNNTQNDVAPVTILQRHEGGAALLDIDVNCRDYFIARLRDSDMPLRPGSPMQRFEPGAPQKVVKKIPSRTVQTPPLHRHYAHQVVAGETLSSIARKHCVSVTTLARINQIQDPSHIHIGDVLRLPDTAC